MPKTKRPKYKIMTERTKQEKIFIVIALIVTAILAWWLASI
jgi:hypothetical protein